MTEHPMQVDTPVAGRRCCTAHSKRTGEPCKQPAMVGKNVCRLHGGKSLSGPASGTWKTGRYSRFLPARMLADYKRALNDPDLLAMRADVALVEARLADLLKRVDSGESGALWGKLQATWLGLEKARKEADTANMAALMATLGSLINRGAADRETWGEVVFTLDQKRKLSESERKRLIDLQQMMTSEQAMALLAAVIDVVRTNVTDRTILAAISADIARLVAGSSGGRVEPV